MSDDFKDASTVVADSFKWIRTVVITWLIAVFVLISSALGIMYAKVDDIDHTVVSHNTELAQTLDAACVLIKSDPQLNHYIPKDCSTVHVSVSK